MSTTRSGLASTPPSFWFALFAGPLAWTAHLLVSYALLPVVCATGWMIILHLVTLVSAAVTAAGVLVAFRAWVEARSEPRTGVQGTRTGYRWFMALVSLLSNLLFLFVIVMEGLPNFFLRPCGYA